MKLSVIGCGYLGAVHASAMAELGHEVVGIDVDARKIAAARRPAVRRSSSPGLPEILASATATGRLRFTTDIADAADADGALRRGRHAAVRRRRTPPTSATWTPRSRRCSPTCRRRPRGRQEHRARRHRRAPRRPPRRGATAARARLESGVPARGLRREGHDRARPARLRRRRATARGVACSMHVYARRHRGGHARASSTDYATAELVKVAANAFLATKISLHQRDGRDRRGDRRRRHPARRRDRPRRTHRPPVPQRRASASAAAACPKDIRAFTARAEELGRGESVAFLKEVDAINLRRRQRVVDLARRGARRRRCTARRSRCSASTFKPALRRRARLARARRGGPAQGARRRRRGDRSRRASRTRGSGIRSSCTPRSTEEALRQRRPRRARDRVAGVRRARPGARQGHRSRVDDHRRAEHPRRRRLEGRRLALRRHGPELRRPAGRAPRGVRPAGRAEAEGRRGPVRHFQIERR